MLGGGVVGPAKMAYSTCKRRPGGKYCCLPGCNGSSNNNEKLFLIPKLSGKRYGEETRDWAEKFHQVCVAG